MSAFLGKGKGIRAGKLVTSDKQQRTLLSYFSKVQHEIPKTLTLTNGNGKTTLDESSFDEKVDHEETQPSKRFKFTPSEDKEIQAQVRLVEKTKKLNILDKNMGLSWYLALEKEFDKDYFKTLNDFVTHSRNRGTVFPPERHVWEWTRQSSIRDVKVVILGQDPYHGEGQAHGLCFSVLNVNTPPSLVNMYKELSTDISNFNTPNHGDLTGWASQGVLLLNAVLTVDAHQANSHKDQGWEKVTDVTISWISQNLNSIVFLLWGAYAQKKAAVVDKKKHHLLQAVHPSPLSAHRGFFGCKHFSKCNALLIAAGKKPIDWNHLPKTSN